MTDVSRRVAIRKAAFLLLAATWLCIGTASGTQQHETETSASTGRMRWQPWQVPEETRLSAVEAELQEDLNRHLETSIASVNVVETFPLAGDLLDGRTFWASLFVTDGSEFFVVVHERSGRVWREVARHRMDYHIYGAVAAVRIEPEHAWIFAWGGAGTRGIPLWHVLRFDGESLREAWSDNWDNWWDVMFVDIDLDGALDILGETRERILCQPCALMSRSVGLYRWNGAEMTEAPLETLAAGSVSDAAVTANNRAVELAGAGRWTEALAVLDDARAVVAESVVFRRNAALIDLTAVDPAGDGLSDDRLLHYIFAGLWTEAVDLFRDAPVRPDLFAGPPDYMHMVAARGMYGTPPFLKAIFDATTAARTVAPPRPEIEFLHGWSAYHLQDWSDQLDRTAPADPATESRYWDISWVRFPIDVDESAMLDALDRAVALAPDDPLFAEARRFVAGGSAR